MSILNDRIWFLLIGMFWVQLSIGQNYFTENKGQWPNNVLYRAEFEGAFVYLEKDGFLIDAYDIEVFQKWNHGHTHLIGHPISEIPSHAFKLEIAGISDELDVIASHEELFTSNYFLGEKQNWANDAKSYRTITYKNIYPNIDIEIKGWNGQFKYDWIVHPGSNLEHIKFRYLGTDKVKVQKGKLTLTTQIKEYEEHLPLSYIKTNEHKRSVDIHYTKKGSFLGFDSKSKIDLNDELYIDPILIFSTYSGSTANNFGYTATFDSKGFLYAGSTAFGSGYPTELGAYLNFLGGTIDVAITKYDTTGTFRIYSTYLGGSNNEMPHSLIVNSNDELFIYGTTGSSNFPISDNAFQSQFMGGPPVSLQNGLGFNFDQGEDIFITRLNENGNALMTSTFVGGTGADGLNLASPLNYNYADQVRGEILIDLNDNIYVASSSSSSDFPVSENALQSQLSGTQDGVLFKMDNNLTSMVWSTYIGGDGVDAVYALDLDEEGNPLVCGGTNSNNLFISTNAFQTDYGGGQCDGFLTKVKADGSEILNATYAGFDMYDQIYFVEYGPQGSPHIYGQTETGDNYIIDALYSNLNSGQFISRVNEDLSSIDWSMTFGNGNGEPNISPTAFLVDACGQIYLSGWGSSIQGGTLTTNGLVTSADAYQDNTDGNDFYLYVTRDDVSIPIYASYFGGNQSAEHIDGGTSRFDKTGKIYQGVCAGCGGFDDFPIYPNDAVSSMNGNNCNLGVFKIDFEQPLVIADFGVDAVCLPDAVEFENLSFNGADFIWDFGDNEQSTLVNPTHIYTEPGIYEVQLIANNIDACNFSDTLKKQILVLSLDDFEIEEITSCPGGLEQIGITPPGDASISYSWSPETGLSDPTAPNPFLTVSSSSQYTLTISNGICSSNATQNINVLNLDLQTSPDTVICSGDMVELSINGQGIASNYQWSGSLEFDPIIATDSSLTITPDSITTLYISADYLSCQSIDSVTVYPSNLQALVSDDQFICASELINLEALNLFPSVEIFYDWSPDPLIISGNNTAEITTSPNENTWFFVDMENEYGCSWIDSIFVEVSLLNPLAVNVTATESIIVQSSSTMLNGIPGDPYLISWSPTTGLSNPNSSSTSASPNSTTTYVYTVIDESQNGQCIGTDSITITVVEINCGFPVVFIPNAFTPNDDEENDILFVEGNFIDEMHLQIFDRWGEKVFESFDQEIGWDGTYKDRELDPDVYAYLLVVKCIDGQEFEDKGNITLIR